MTIKFAAIHLSREIGFCNIVHSLVDRVECMIVFEGDSWCRIGSRSEGNADFAESVAKHLKERDVAFVDIINTGKLPRPTDIGSGPANEYADELLGGGIQRSFHCLPFDELGYKHVREVLSKSFKIVEFPSDEQLAMGNFISGWATGFIKLKPDYEKPAIPFGSFADVTPELFERIEDGLGGCMYIELTDEIGSHMTCTCVARNLRSGHMRAWRDVEKQASEMFKPGDAEAMRNLAYVERIYPFKCEDLKRKGV